MKTDRTHGNKDEIQQRGRNDILHVNPSRCILNENAPFGGGGCKFTALTSHGPLSADS